MHKNVSYHDWTSNVFFPGFLSIMWANESDSSGVYCHGHSITHRVPGKIKILTKLNFYKTHIRMSPTSIALATSSTRFSCHPVGQWERSECGSRACCHGWGHADRPGLPLGPWQSPLSEHSRLKRKYNSHL